MNIILYDQADCIGPSTLLLTGVRAQHVIRVHGSGVGDTIRIGQVQGFAGQGVIVALDDVSVRVEIEQLDIPPPPKLPLTVVLALPRPKVLRRVLRSMVELGVKSIVLLNAWKVEKSYWQSPLLAADSLRECLLAGLVQCGDTILPELNIRRRFKPFVEDELPVLSVNTRRIVAHPGDYPACPVALNCSCTLVIGPEGGFISDEIAMLRQMGFECVSAGPRILRVETAVSSLIGRIGVLNSDKIKI